MAKCKNCNNLIDLTDVTQGSEEKFKWCPIKNDSLDALEERECSSFKAMTNGDRIRSMTDEELAVIIMCPQSIDVSMCLPDHDCVKCALEWLQSPEVLVD